jgi:hypothetical protein
MPRSFRLQSRFLQGGLLGFLAAAVAVAGPLHPEQPGADQPTPVRAAAQLPTELQYVPADAAFFLHADAAGIWTSDLAKSFRAADKTLFVKLEEAAKAFGVKIDELKSVVVFVPKLKTPNDTEQFGVVLTFSKAFDKDKLAAGAKELLPKNAKHKVLTPSDTVAVVLVGLGDEYGKPQPADADGPLSAAIRAAASGKHTLVAASTLGNLPDELQKDDLPGQVRAFQPIFKAQSITATVNLGKSLDLSVRVKTKREALAVDAEKALAAFITLVTDELDRELPDLEKEAAKDVGMKDLVKVFKATLTAAKGAKFSVEGTEARLAATLPLDGLPLASAYLTATTKVTGAAAAQQSANNLKQIALAMHGYHDAIGSFPPAAVCDKKGKPQLSWRVLILPYIEQDALYKQFKLDEPWDSDNNKKLIAKMPKIYAPPNQNTYGYTFYRGFTGPNTWLPPQQQPGRAGQVLLGVKSFQISDGTSNTILVAEALEAVVWTKPDELVFAPNAVPKLGGVFGSGFTVVIADGSARFVRNTTSPTMIANAIQINDGNPVNLDE